MQTSLQAPDFIPFLVFAPVSDPLCFFVKASSLDADTRFKWFPKGRCSLVDITGLGSSSFS